MDTVLQEVDTQNEESSVFYAMEDLDELIVKLDISKFLASHLKDPRVDRRVIVVEHALLAVDQSNHGIVPHRPENDSVVFLIDARFCIYSPANDPLETHELTRSVSLKKAHVKLSHCQVLKIQICFLTGQMYSRLSGTSGKNFP